MKQMKRMKGKQRRDRQGRWSRFGNSITNRRTARAKMRSMPTLTVRRRSKGDLYAANGSLRSVRRKRLSLYQARRDQRRR